MQAAASPDLPYQFLWRVAVVAKASDGGSTAGARAFLRTKFKAGSWTCKSASVWDLFAHMFSDFMSSLIHVKYFSSAPHPPADVIKVFHFIQAETSAPFWVRSHRNCLFQGGLISDLPTSFCCVSPPNPKRPRMSKTSQVSTDFRRSLRCFPNDPKRTQSGK